MLIRTTAVVAAYNEVATVGTVVRTLQAYPMVNEVIVIDDCSDDGRTARSVPRCAACATRVDSATAVPWIVRCARAAVTSYASSTPTSSGLPPSMSPA